MPPVRTFVGLGANLGDPERNVLAAIALLERSEHRLGRAAPLYRTEPVGGPEGQPEYVNTVVELWTEAAPVPLLAELKAIEQQLGRLQRERWAPREIDLDLLLYGDLVLRTTELCIPHPELHRRRFVLEPLADLAPDLVIPGLGSSVEELLRALPGGHPRARRLDG